ncbi:acylphosphatase [Antrihabitans sp. YC2-6]|uniref:acylphosphatase n=1 Tax=Antrihabitans sp. YC2-6 TaxID=2799498 RepID=UPI0018F32B26|nr:acylphosphatase [Antrihabitans sp. YC2-6]MBJ8343343.1 acylphosphatase [Antrihabitans sp. YC2-6]
MADIVRLSAWVHGSVQGVGFRWWTRSRALELGLTGHATNTSDGRVHVIAEGSRSRCDKLLALLRSGSTPGRVDLVVESWDAAKGDVTGFEER